MPRIKGFERLTVIRRKAEKIDFSAPKHQPENLLKAAAREVAPKVREILVSNLKKSGIQERTGKLKRVVSRSNVWYQKGRIRYALRAAVDQKTHTYANSLHYGFVVQPQMQRTIADLPTGTTKMGRAGILGSKAVRTLKRQVLRKMGQSKSADRWRTGQTHGKSRYHGAKYNTKKYSTTKKGNAQLSITGTFNDGERERTTKGTVTVVNPKPYYYLNVVQEQYIMRLFKGHLERLLYRRSKRHAARLSS